ncbi:hypothetical protein MMC21_008213 [Puttea exsequens]|nr:hypothetical protein [Puttea exsequens]
MDLVGVKLHEAYETLSDDDRRRKYDAERCIIRENCGSAQADATVKQEREESEKEAARVRERDREWAAQRQIPQNRMARLKQEIRSAEAAIKEMERKEWEKMEQEKQARGWLTYILNPWSTMIFETEQEKKQKSRERIERMRQRTSKERMLQAAKQQLTQADLEYQNIISTQKQTREREDRSREERMRDASLKRQREQLARERAAIARRAREEAARAAEEVRRETARKEKEGEAAQAAAAGRQAQEAERKERDLRQQLFERIAKQNTADSLHHPSSTTRGTISQNPNQNPRKGFPPFSPPLNPSQPQPQRRNPNPNPSQSQNQNPTLQYKSTHSAPTTIATGRKSPAGTSVPSVAGCTTGISCSVRNASSWLVRLAKWGRAISDDEAMMWGAGISFSC